MKRKKDSHKGQNGKVLIIGGSEHFHGAPILCSLGAENSGADLIFPYLPASQQEAAKTYSLNFILHSFEKNHLSTKDVSPILKMSEMADVVVIGPGLGDAAETKKAIKSILMKLEKPTVIDASALIYTNALPKTVVLTPHRGEFKQLTGEEPSHKTVQKWAKNLGATIVVKGPEDIIANKDKLLINKTGNALMTVGGTGDVLSGLIGGLMAQGIEPIEACHIATETLGSAAEELALTHNNLKAHDLVKELPRLLEF